VSDEREAWVTVRVSPGSNRDAVMAAMFNAGVQGIEEVGDALVTHVSGQPFANDVLCAVISASPDARVETMPLPNVDWSERWKLGIHVQSLGALSVAPPWLSADLDPARTIVIEPAMAFGTGEHATTRGVIRLLQRVIRPGDRVADLGTGSAVLAIAAAKLGARHVAAIEIDPDAIGNAEENVAVAFRPVRITSDYLSDRLIDGLVKPGYFRKNHVLVARSASYPQEQDTRTKSPVFGNGLFKIEARI